MSAPTPPLPGWYPDPSGEPGLRYWDGTWTDHRQPSLVPPPPHEPVPKRRSHTPGVRLSRRDLPTCDGVPAIAMFNGHDSVNPFAVLWLLWGGFWTVLWWLFAKGRA